MENKQDSGEVVLDIKKILETFKYRKFLMLKTFLACVLFFVLLTVVSPKEYETSADLYIDKANDTNLAELNPYLISMSGSTGGYSSLLTGKTNALQNEIELMRSSIVIDKVIIENNLKYKKGKKKGEYISTEAFFENNIEIVNKKGSNIVTIYFESSNPKLNYNIVKSIIKNYQQLNEDINTKRALKDKGLLEATYKETAEKLDDKLSKMNDSNVVFMDSSKYNFGAMGSTIKSIKSNMIEGRKSQIGIEQEIEKLKLVKTKLEWTNLVEKMARESTNVIVLKQPKLKREFENSGPNLKLNVILGIVIGFLLSIIAVTWKETTDKKLSYSVLGENIIYDKNDLALLDLLLKIAKDEQFVLINHSSEKNILKEISNVEMINASEIEANIETIKKASKVILAGEIGQTEKESYLYIKQVCQNLNKEISNEILINE